MTVALGGRLAGGIPADGRSDTEFVYWDTGTAYLLPRLLRLPDGTSRTSGPLFLAARKPAPAAVGAFVPSRRCPRSEHGPASPGLDDYSPMAHMAAILI
jgi:hypothetical protein